ncbi:MAG: hypothetical protein J3K34DRAFT_397572 [Monoraphidium minutum]|nr:MAG: hypothetical protein J3K34DRAFT_397572 [Monoraphidium minutum]
MVPSPAGKLGKLGKLVDDYGRHMTPYQLGCALALLAGFATGRALREAEAAGGRGGGGGFGPAPAAPGGGLTARQRRGQALIGACRDVARRCTELLRGRPALTPCPSSAPGSELVAGPGRGPTLARQWGHPGGRKGSQCQDWGFSSFIRPARLQAATSLPIQPTAGHQTSTPSTPLTPCLDVPVLRGPKRQLHPRPPHHCLSRPPPAIRPQRLPPPHPCLDVPVLRGPKRQLHPRPPCHARQAYRRPSDLDAFCPLTPYSICTQGLPAMPVKPTAGHQTSTPSTPSPPASTSLCCTAPSANCIQGSGFVDGVGGSEGHTCGAAATAAAALVAAVAISKRGCYKSWGCRAAAPVL